ncbi:MAG: hypothetical protein EOP04_19050 [Proteobacteria bacterium]|nr:MAG: hypothetical protein EOP04_19050 [Pseudomonadota bacterium]
MKKLTSRIFIVVLLSIPVAACRSNSGSKGPTAPAAAQVPEDTRPELLQTEPLSRDQCLQELALLSEFRKGIQGSASVPSSLKNESFEIALLVNSGKLDLTCLEHQYSFAQ